MESLGNFSQLLHSRCITIHAGKGDCKFFVHEALLSKSSSESLQKLVKPGWRESSEGCIDWTHTNSQTVERVLTWLYFGDYQSPDPVPREVGDPHETGSDRHASETREGSQPAAQGSEGVDDTPVEVEPEFEAEIATDEPEPEVDAVPDSPAAESDPLEAEDPELQNAIFESCSVRPLTPLGKCVGVPPLMTVYKSAGGVFQDREFPHKAFSYLEPLLAHVGVYSFAKYHLLSGLKELALQRTIVTLRKLDCSVDHAEQELTKAIEFVYDNIPADEENEEPMRKLFSQFAAANYTSLMHGSFEVLFTGGGDFALDLARKLSRRLLAHGVSAGLVEDELEGRIQNLELQVQERDQEIKTLNEDLNEALRWGRGLNKKGRRR
ncbi:hypothetical protein AYL99_06377 [Fonsecaea erecta]|uniref:BTB domain-containing protein n=1 Tax=Fonsecaea erecta TaxID=1367422 RepID=A0A178ZH02_9EURO|nr:hypothetical protein AYL99_06377 [Fonsecaea erecta]OAP59079.1 hypothetical protein AYL99_06377 [Fonsecaea erecta]